MTGTGKIHVYYGKGKGKTTAAIGLNTNIVKLVKTGGKPILMGMACWIGITLVSLGMQHVLGIW